MPSSQIGPGRTSGLLQDDALKSRKMFEMKALKAWAEALGIEPAKIQAWAQEAPQHESLTFWCLLSGRIRSSDYFAWAVEHYGLAMLSEGYFAQNPNRDLWMKIQSVANWSAQLLPVDEWDGTVFVACVEPPDGIQWSFPVQYVLATARDLQSHWERLQSEPTRVSTAQSLSLENVQPASAEISDIAQEAPAGLAINIAVPPKIMVPDGITPLKASPTEKAPLTDEPLGILDLDSVKPPALNLSAPAMPSSKVVEATSFVAPEPVKPSTGSSTGLIAAVDAMPQPVDPKADMPLNGEIDSDRLAPTNLTAESSEIEVIAWGFQQLKLKFKYSWLMMVHGENLSHYCWDASVKPTSPHAKDPIDLSQPSLFRIVVRTRMPYHGHVVERPVNTGFFRAWGIRKTPPHVTAIPLSSGGHLVALLLCAGDKPEQLDQVLRFTEKTGTTILAHLAKKQNAA